MYHCKSCACTADLCSRMQLLRSLFDNICSRSLFTHATFEISVWQHIQQIFVHTCTIWNLCLTIYAAHLCSRMQLLRSLFDNIYSRPLFTQATFEISVWQHIQQIFVHACNFWDLCLTTYTADLCSHMHHLSSVFRHLQQRALLMHISVESWSSVCEHLQQRVLPTHLNLKFWRFLHERTQQSSAHAHKRGILELCLWTSTAESSAHIFKRGILYTAELCSCA